MILKKYQEIDDQLIKKNDVLFEEIFDKIDQKVNINDFDEQLSNKASKKSVTNALHLKLNKSDFETYMALKADNSIIQSLENKISNKLETQAFNQ